MGVVYHANYFVWFEVGRVELLRGNSACRIVTWSKKDGCGIAVTDAALSLQGPGAL